MWAMRLVGPGRFETVDVPAPDPDTLRDGEVLLRTLAGGICGSDRPKLHRVNSGEVGPAGYPMHEVVGEVVASRHPLHQDGDTVVGWAVDSNAMAELVVTQGLRIAGCDPSADPVEQVLIQSVACVLHAVDKLSVRGARVAVLGLGPIGLTFAHVLAARGARHVTGVDPIDRQGVGSRFGIDDVVVATSSAWSAGLSGVRPDVVVEAVGHQVQTLDDALRAVAVGGTVLYFGIPDQPVYPMNMEMLMRRHLNLVGGVTREHASALEAARDYLNDHPELVRHLLTHRFNRPALQQAFNVADEPSEGRLKVVVDLAARQEIPGGWRADPKGPSSDAE